VWGAGANERVEITATDELDRALDELSREAEEGQPILVDLGVPERGHLSIGLGRARTVLSFVPWNQEPPYLASRGGSPEGGDLVFFFDGHWTDFPPEASVSLSDGRAAMRIFLSTGELDPRIQWEEV